MINRSYYSGDATEEEAYWSGHRAYEQGASIESNPYDKVDPHENSLYLAWRSGWLDFAWNIYGTGKTVIEYDSHELEDAYAEGREAYWNSHKRVIDNPYTGVDQDDLYIAWNNGYYDAAWDD